AVDAGARDEIVQARLDTEIALRDAIGFPRFTQPTAVDRELSFLSQAPRRSGVPCKEASGRALRFNTTLNVVAVRAAEAPRSGTGAVVYSLRQSQISLPSRLGIHAFLVSCGCPLCLQDEAWA